MAEFYTWTQAELGLNVTEMDREHQELIARMNTLYKTAQNKADTVAMGQALADLAAFTVKHFADEEAYMEKIGFPGLPTHKLIHQQLLSQFNGYAEEFKKTNTLSDSFFNFLKVWLTSHIRGIDMKYADHSRAKKAA